MMSAFVVNDAHINALVSWAAMEDVHYFDPHINGTCRVIAETGQKVGQTLLAENCRSVNYCYRETSNSAEGYRFKMSLKPLSPVQVLKAIKCLRYQSCEHPEWSNSTAAEILNAIEACAIPKLAGYEDADWEIAA